MKERATFVRDNLSDGTYLFNAPTTYDEQTVSKKWKEDSSSVLGEWKDVLETIETFNHENIETAFKSFLSEKNLGIGAVLPLFRLLLTGTGMGPSMFEIAEFLGKEESLLRMNQGLTSIEALKNHA
jgi:glutamyl-tRNA synthetase